ncbi:MAG: YdbH domain-containing protein, partial [Sphingomonadales bacterium]|nr:YdbH domain-containing protein [Sphingomonadales bacterium]
GGTWRFSGQATMTGPLLGGRISGLSLPVSGTFAGGVLAMNGSCTDVRYQGLETGALRLPAGRLRACPERGSMLRVGGGQTKFALNIPKLSVAGTLGSSPLRASGSAISFDLDRGFAANQVAVDLGVSESLSRFTVARIDGRMTGDGVAGSLIGGAGQIGNVPLLIGETEGQWRWQDGVLGLDATLFVSDAAEVDRFNRLRVPNFQLTLADNKIVAIGDLAEPESSVTVANAQIQHDLGNSIGNTLLSVDNLQFNDRLQPEQITPLTLGSIANVQGQLSGDGRIDWNGEAVTSSGRFTVERTDLAAAFGPVDLPDQKVKIEEGRWPFYGGELILEPTILDFDVEAKRELTFRMVGLDAEKFLGNYDIENLRVAGVFDGTLPMVFDQEGGRIVGGWLVSRPGGGELSYLGEISYKDMGVMANFAFDALRSIRFEEMQIGVDGNLGGEVVTEVRFRGLQQGSLAKRNYITRQLAKLPIEFNVRIAAEFLSLIANLRSVYDGEYAAQRFGSQVLDAAPVTGEAAPPK